MIQFPPKFVAALTVIAVAISTHCLPAVAQEHFIGEGQAVNRVIKLRSQPRQAPPPKQIVEQTSRGDHVARITKPVASPNEIQFDDIQVPRSLQHQIRPAVQNSAPVVESSNFQPAEQQFSPAAPKNILALPNQQQNLQNDVAAESVTVRKNMVSTEIRSPKSVNVHQPAQIQINVRNLSEETIDNVTLIASVPLHAKFVSATPRPTRMEGQTYEFVVPRIGGEQTQQVLLNVIPTEKTPLEIGTQVLVENIQRTIVGVQQPELAMKISGPVHATTGNTVMHTLTITNIGDGIAHDIQLETSLPGALKRTNDSDPLEISSLQPGASLEVPVESRALTPGEGALKFVATATNIETKQASLNMVVFQPELRLSAVGPKLNFVHRDGIYSINIENTGEVDVTNVQVSLQVPDGMKVTTISRQAEVDADRGILSWSFEKMSAKSNEQIQLKTTAIKEGQQVCNILISSNETLEKEFQLATQVATRADLSVRIKNETGPIQVGAKGEFLVEVENQGSRQATDVSVHVALPESLMPVKEGQEIGQIENSFVFREPVVAPGQKVTFKFTAVGISKGDQVVRSTLQAADSDRKVISEDSVYVYEVDEARISEALSPVIPR